VIEKITELLQTAVETLIQQGDIPADATFRIQVDRVKDKNHGDFSTNLAMMLAKPCRKAPRIIAQAIIEALPETIEVAKVEIAGPGFINFFLSQDTLVQFVESALADPALNVQTTHTPETIVVDYSSPNLAKEMHVGHLRSTIIGDAVARTLAFLGHHVQRQNHVGDWGTQFGMLLAYMQEIKTEGQVLDMQLSNIETFYRAAKQRFDAAPDFAEQARALVVKLQAGDADCLQLWQDFKRISLGHCEQIYARLNVSLRPQDVRAESAYNDDLAQVVESLEAQGLLTDDAGARCVFLPQFKGKNDDVVPIIVQKQGGGYLYATTDLAAMRYRVKTLHATRILYFVDVRQSLHFQQVFALAKTAHFVPADTSLEHMPFGTVMGSDGKPFKTREGGVAKLADLLDEAQKRAYALVANKNPALPEAQLQHIATVIGIASVKYADLSKNRGHDYVFSWDQMLSFEGNTAPYLLYAYTRVMSIFRKGGVQAEHLTAPVQLQAAQEIDLVTQLSKLNEVIQQVAKRGMPHLLCTYLYTVSGHFSRFYEACPVLQAGDEALTQSRLKLCLLTAKTLHVGLGLLGIDTLERM